MSDDVKPEPIKRDHKFARATFSIAITTIVCLGAFEVIPWLTQIRR